MMHWLAPMSYTSIWVQSELKVEPNGVRYIVRDGRALCETLSLIGSYLLALSVEWLALYVAEVL